MILNPIHTKSAHLIWQSPLGKGLSRRRLPIALLQSNEDGSKTSFKYLTETPEFEQASTEGFKGYIGIPLNRSDTSDAIKTLGRRLLAPERPDYNAYLARNGISANSGLSTLSLLAYTGAKLTSDSYSVSDTFEGFDRPFQYIFDVAGRRHAQSETPSPKLGEQVIFRAEPSNEFDPNAVELINENGNRFGYVNACQAEIVNKWLKEGEIRARVFRVNGRAAYPRLFIFADIVPNLKRQAA